MIKNKRSQFLLLSLTNAVLVAIFAPSTIASPIASSASGNIDFEDSPSANQVTLFQDWVNHEKVYDDTSVTYTSASCSAGEKEGHIPSDRHGPTVLISSKDVTPYRSDQPRGKAFFRSTTMPPADGLRAVIRNTSITGGKTPYSNREYDNGSQSEKFFVSPSTVHQSKYLAIQPGENRMTYEIRRGKTVVESGAFLINVTINDRYITRSTTRPATNITIPCIKDHNYKKKHHHDKHDRHHKHKRDRDHHIRREHSH
jgi:hypothetical protein